MALSGRRSSGSIAFSHWEKVPEGRMRGLLPVENVATTAQTVGANPLIRRSAPPSPNGRRETVPSFDRAPE